MSESEREWAHVPDEKTAYLVKSWVNFQHWDDIRSDLKSNLKCWWHKYRERESDAAVVGVGGRRSRISSRCEHLWIQYLLICYWDGDRATGWVIWTEFQDLEGRRRMRSSFAWSSSSLIHTLGSPDKLYKERIMGPTARVLTLIV